MKEEILSCGVLVTDNDGQQEFWPFEATYADADWPLNKLRAWPVASRVTDVDELLKHDQARRDRTRLKTPEFYSYEYQLIELAYAAKVAGHEPIEDVFSYHFGASECEICWSCSEALANVHEDRLRLVLQAMADRVKEAPTGT